MPSLYARRPLKRCAACREEKALAEFYYAKERRQYSFRCKMCIRFHRREQHWKMCGEVRSPRHDQETRRILAEGWHHCDECGLRKPVERFEQVEVNGRIRLRNTCRDCRCVQERERAQRRREGATDMRTEEETRRLLAGGWHTCRDCGTEKPVAEFGTRWVKGHQTVFNACKDCKRTRKDKLVADPWTKFLYAVRSRCTTFGITVRDYLLRLQSQEFLCAICGQLLPLTDQALDHDHDTGAVRGILHNKCNVMLGLARENVATLRGAATYLEHHKGTLAV